MVRERYTVEELLGQGGFGAVYRVRDRRVKGNLFALKEVVEPNVHQRASFAFEGEILRRLDHSALPHVYRVFEDTKNNRLYMLMDYIDGPNLEHLRQRQPLQRFSFSQVMQLMAPIIEAVKYLHAQQPPIIHRDIKPSNIIVPLVNEAGAVLVDFGIAKEYDQDSTTTAIRHCSPGYGAPEQYVHGTSTQTDIYGLGATFYALLTGVVPIDALYRITRLSGRGADPLDLATAVVPTLPPAVAEILQRAMAVNSQDRFATVEEFWDALQNVPHLPLVPKEDPITDPGLDLELETQAHSLEQSDILSLIASPTCAPATPLSLPPLLVRPSRPRGQVVLRTTSLIAMMLVVMLVALSLGLALGTNAWWDKHHLQVSRAPVSVPTHSSSSSPLLKQPSPALTPSPPASDQTVYPQLQTSYYGNIHDAPAASDSTMALSLIQQSGSLISGYFSAGLNLMSDGKFTGTVGNDRKIQFRVSIQNTMLPLVFAGRIQADGSISGAYCSMENNHCNYTKGGYGNWSVSP
ncbi:hypothetical protein KTT_19460 [Tengunoibacter tsumagoiensis]|uniref:Protein kinase domain-containing protein n=1 Tax=Tengunoibacter tsumagoiensis TaxID=2014871 RepID=A0A401ZZ23_9CHLR|nr:hypothetical protein KTT_19460 [Tengunoibacter tsumagoiensis]